MKKLLTTMYDSVCAQKELLKLLIEEFEEEKSNQVQVKDEPENSSRASVVSPSSLAVEPPRLKVS